MNATTGSFLQSMMNGQETERTRIAKDLHDGLGGLFSTIKMHFSTLQHEKNEMKAIRCLPKVK
ncbi:MAG: histidine kinase dimerization/phosphoacceptor domain-containing protein [Chitinophagaceae bacterium]|nr:histidine kinase dimerization/phosphoacceptor domain-containing protein [Chitinophagaceae bacterium]